MLKAAITRDTQVPQFLRPQGRSLLVDYGFEQGPRASRQPLGTNLLRKGEGFVHFQLFCWKYSLHCQIFKRIDAIHAEPGGYFRPI